MTSRQAQIQEDTYFRVMCILQENPDLTQRELAEKLGVSVGGLNYCLKALMDKGWVKMQNFQNSKNKFKYVYLDELPQFWSVLIGTMSVVGPRPHVTPQNVEYLQKIDSYLLRHQVKPGLTGWAQVNGARGEMPDIQHMQTRLNYDLYYIHRWSFWLDLQIILQTIVNLFKGDVHAY